MEEKKGKKAYQKPMLEIITIKCDVITTSTSGYEYEEPDPNAGTWIF